MDRRSFLGMLPMVGLAGAPRLAAAHVTASRTDGRPGDSLPDAWGVQLYTLRDALADDLDATLSAVAEIGYEEVELFQLHGRSPRALRATLDRVGLRAVSSHHGIEALRDDLSRTIDGALELGQRLMVVPSIPGAERDADGLARVADDLNRAGERARAAGLRMGYHNHDWELRPLADGRRPIDVLLDRTGVDLVDWQMDIFWTVHGGADPLAMLRERSGRVTSVHVKDRTSDGRMVDVGQGAIDFAAVLAVAEELGLLHAFVEHDRPGDAVESVRRSFRHLASLEGDR